MNFTYICKQIHGKESTVNILENRMKAASIRAAIPANDKAGFRGSGTHPLNFNAIARNEYFTENVVITKGVTLKFRVRQKRHEIIIKSTRVVT